MGENRFIDIPKAVIIWYENHIASSTLAQNIFHFCRTFRSSVRDCEQSKGERVITLERDQVEHLRKQKEQAKADKIKFETELREDHAAELEAREQLSKLARKLDFGKSSKSC